MLSPKIRNQYSDHPQTIMRPVHLKLSEEDYRPPRTHHARTRF